MRTLHRSLVSIFLVGACGMIGACATEGGDGDPLEDADALSQDVVLNKGSYLALGDSIPYGWDVRAVDPSKTWRFVGYPEVNVLPLRYKLTNASCPGETSSHLVSLAGADLDCAGNRARYGIKVDYAGSQLEYALSWLATHPDAKLVTVQVGGNDLAALQIACAGEPTCIVTQLPATLGQYGDNLGVILGSIRQRYAGRLVVVNYYPSDYENQLEVLGFGALNDVIDQVAAATGAIVGDAWSEFAEVSGDRTPCEAGLLTPLGGGACDYHPSLAGQIVLARTVREAQ